MTKRTAKEAEAMIIAGLKEAVAIHRGEAKPARERVYDTETGKLITDNPEKAA